MRVVSGSRGRAGRRWAHSSGARTCQPAKAFEIAITALGVHVSSWRYDFEETPGGCTVTESWEDHRPFWTRPGSRMMGDHSGDHARQEMVATLANLAAAAGS
jgi:hypothetical protein